MDARPEPETWAKWKKEQAQARHWRRIWATWVYDVVAERKSVEEGAVSEVRRSNAASGCTRRV